MLLHRKKRSTKAIVPSRPGRLKRDLFSKSCKRGASLAHRYCALRAAGISISPGRSVRFPDPVNSPLVNAFECDRCSTQKQSIGRLAWRLCPCGLRDFATTHATKLQ